MERHPTDETRRLAELESLGLLDTPSEERFDRITRIAASALHAPMAAVSLVADGRQWLKSEVGMTQHREIPRSQSFCTYALGSDEPLVVPDATTDARFADNPLVTAPGGLRSYAGRRILGPGGEALGALCVLSDEPRRADSFDTALLAELARWVEHEIAEDAAERSLTTVRGRLVASIGHALRTPLTTIRGGAEGLAESITAPLTDAQRLDLEMVLDGTDRLTDLAEALTMLATDADRDEIAARIERLGHRV